MQALSIYAGPRALTHLRQHGLRAADIGIVPAAAGGPKGLIFQALDQWLFGSYLPSSPRERHLIGASIGAWRMAAACAADPVAAFERLGHLYCGQRYNAKPTPQQIHAVCERLLENFVGGQEARILAHPQYRLHLLAGRGKRALAAPRHRRAELAGFAAAALLNLGGRARLAHMMERVVLSSPGGAPAWMAAPFDGFTTHHAALDPASLQAALLASGTLPLIMQPVRSPGAAPPGYYWDGGIIDYHLALPYSRASDLVLYPHFGRHIVPGWLDKALPWRRAKGPWLDNVIVVAPSAAFLATLPRRKLPDRKDFTHYGLDHERRIAAWQHAIGEGQRLRDELAAFAERPDPGRVQAL